MAVRNHIIANNTEEGVGLNGTAEKPNMGRYEARNLKI